MSPRREDLGSWLEGTPGGRHNPSGQAFPDSGPGSLARPGRRILALCIDWALAMAISAAFFPSPDPPSGGLLAGEPLATMAVFGVSTAILVGMLGHTIGHRVAGLRVVSWRDPGREDAARGAAAGARPPGPLSALMRTALLCLVIPAVIWERGGRGLHDVAAGTAIVRR